MRIPPNPTTIPTEPDHFFFRPFSTYSKIGDDRIHRALNAALQIGADSFVLGAGPIARPVVVGVRFAKQGIADLLGCAHVAVHRVGGAHQGYLLGTRLRTRRILMVLDGRGGRRTVREYLLL